MDYIPKHRGVLLSVCRNPATYGAAKCKIELLDRAEVCRFFGGLNASTLYRGIRLGRYPKPVKVGPGSSRWLRSECESCPCESMVEGRAA